MFGSCSALLFRVPFGAPLLALPGLFWGFLVPRRRGGSGHPPSPTARFSKASLDCRDRFLKVTAKPSPTRAAGSAVSKGSGTSRPVRFLQTSSWAWAASSPRARFHFRAPCRTFLSTGLASSLPSVHGRLVGLQRVVHRRTPYAGEKVTGAAWRRSEEARATARYTNARTPGGWAWGARPRAMDEALGGDEVNPAGEEIG